MLLDGYSRFHALLVPWWGVQCCAANLHKRAIACCTWWRERDWLTIVEPTIRPRTWKRYREYMTIHVMPTLGRVPLARLSPQQVQALYAAKLAGGLSTTSVNHLHAVLHRALDSAMRLGLVQRNVTGLVDAPRMRHHDMAPLSAEQVRALLSTIKGDRLEALYVLALTTGMRQASC